MACVEKKLLSRAQCRSSVPQKEGAPERLILLCLCHCQMDTEAAALTQQAEALESSLAKQKQHCQALKVLRQIHLTRMHNSCCANLHIIQGMPTYPKNQLYNKGVVSAFYWGHLIALSRLCPAFAHATHTAAADCGRCQNSKNACRRLLRRRAGGQCRRPRRARSLWSSWQPRYGKSGAVAAGKRRRTPTARWNASSSHLLQNKMRCRRFRRTLSY